MVGMGVQYPGEPSRGGGMAEKWLEGDVPGISFFFFSHEALIPNRIFGVKLSYLKSDQDLGIYNYKMTNLPLS